MVRQSRWREAIAAIFDIPDFLPYLRHLRRIAVTYGVRDEFGVETTNIVKPLYHAAWLGSRLGMTVVKPLAAMTGGVRDGRRPRGGRGAPLANPGAGLGATLRFDRTDVAVVIRPVLSEMPPGTTLRVELLADWRGSELRADVTAEQDAVHVRVWQDGVHALERGFTRRAGPMSTCSPRRSRPAGGIRRGRDARARRPARRRAASMTEPTIVTLADPEACSLAAAERIIEILDVAIDDHGEAHWVTTGGSTPAAIYQHLRRRPCATRSTGGRSTCGGPTTGSCRPTTRCRTPRSLRRLLARFSGSRPGASGADVPTERRPASPIPDDQVHPIQTAAAIAEGHDPDWCAARYAEELQANGPDTNDDGWPVFDLILLGIGPDGHILSVFPDSAAFDRARWALGVPAPTHVEPHVPRVTLNPAIVAGRRTSSLVVATATARPRSSRDVLERPATSRDAARPARPPTGRDVDPRRGGGRPAPVTRPAPGATDPIRPATAGRRRRRRRRLSRLVPRDVRLPARPHRRPGPGAGSATRSSPASETWVAVDGDRVVAMMVVADGDARPALCRAGSARRGDRAAAARHRQGALARTA